jgi:hypothetical protein
MRKVARAHTDSNGRRWEIGDEVDEHPDLADKPWLFDGFEEPVKPKRRTKVEG